MAQIIPIQIRRISDRVSRGEKLFAVLDDEQIPPLDFFKHLKKYPEDKLAFELARTVYLEKMLDESDELITEAMDRTDLEKVKARVALRQWMAEKLIPQTYGQKIDVSHNHTISISSAMAMAEKRVIDVSPEKPNSAPLSINEERVALPQTSIEDLIG